MIRQGARFVSRIGGEWLGVLARIVDSCCITADFGGGFEQAAGVWVLRLPGDLAGGSRFNDFSAIHYRDAGGEIANHGHGVRDEQIGQSELALQLSQQIDDLRSDAYVEGGDGLVGDDEFWAQGEGAGDSDALPLPSTEFMGEPGQDGLVEADRAKQLSDPGAASGQSHLFVNDERLANDALHIHSGVERPEGILEDNLHVAAQAAHLTVGGSQEVVAVETDGAGTGFDQSQHETAQGAFSRS